MDMKERVILILESYHERERQIALLHYEMQHTAHVSPEEVIDTMSLGHGDGMGGSSKGHISNKTMYIALNYQERMNRMNAEAASEIAQCLLELEKEQDRIRYYVSLLEKRKAEVIRLFYIERMTMDNVEKVMHLSAKTLRKLKNQAVDALAAMYEFAANAK